MSDKDRLYVCLYVRGGGPKMPGQEDTYHWAILVGPKTELANSQGMRYHAKEVMGPSGLSWQFEKKSTSLLPTSMLLVRVLVGKIEDKQRLDAVLSRVPIRAGQAGWNCVLWIKEALATLENDGKSLGTRVTEWTQVRDAAMQYCERKRNQGRFKPPKYDPQKVPTYDLTQQSEIVG